MDAAPIARWRQGTIAAAHPRSACRVVEVRRLVALARTAWPTPACATRRPVRVGAVWAAHACPATRPKRAAPRAKHAPLAPQDRRAQRALAANVRAAATVAARAPRARPKGLSPRVGRTATVASPAILQSWMVAALGHVAAAANPHALPAKNVSMACATAARAAMAAAGARAARRVRPPRAEAVAARAKRALSKRVTAAPPMALVPAGLLRRAVQTRPVAAARACAEPSHAPWVCTVARVTSACVILPHAAAAVPALQPVSRWRRKMRSNAGREDKPALSVRTAVKRACKGSVSSYTRRRTWCRPAASR